MGRDAMQYEQFRERLEHINRPQPPGDHDRQAFPRILLDDGEDLQRPAVMRAVRHEVIRPDVVPILRPVADARAIHEPQSAPFRLFLQHFEAFPTPQSLDSFVIHCPAFPAQKPGDAPIPIPPIQRSQLDEARDQPGFVVRDATGRCRCVDRA